MNTDTESVHLMMSADEWNDNTYKYIQLLTALLEREKSVFHHANIHV
nr:hypothetical protein [Bacillus thuringiensis]